MTTYLNKDAILHALATRAERAEHVVQLGGIVRLRELGRAQLRAAGEVSIHDGVRNTDVWHLAIIASGVIDPETHAPLFTLDELKVLAEGDDPPLRADTALALAQRILNLSEVGPEALKSGSAAPDSG